MLERCGHIRGICATRSSGTRGSTPPWSTEAPDQVHTILATNAHSRGQAARARVPFLLKGLTFGSDGRAMSSFCTTKKDRQRGDEGQVLTYASGLRRRGNTMEFPGQYT